MMILENRMGKAKNKSGGNLLGIRIGVVALTLLALAGCSASEEDLKAQVPFIPEQTGLDRASPAELARRKAVRCAPDKVSFAFLEEENTSFVHSDQFRTFFDCANYNYQFQQLEPFFHSDASPEFIDALRDTVNGLSTSQNAQNIRQLLDPWFQEYDDTGKAKIDHILPIVSDVIKNSIFRKGLPLLATMLDYGKPVWNTALQGLSLLVYNAWYPDLWDDMRKLFNILETGEGHNLLAVSTREFFEFLRKENPHPNGGRATNARLLLELGDDLNNFETPEYGFIHLFEYANNRDMFSALYQTASEAMRGEKVLPDLNQSEADMKAKLDSLFVGGSDSPLMQLMGVVREFNNPRPNFLPAIVQWFSSSENKERMHRGMFEFVGKRLIGEILSDFPVAKYINKYVRDNYRDIEYQVPKSDGSGEMETVKCRKRSRCDVPPAVFMEIFDKAIADDEFVEFLNEELPKRARLKFGALNSELLFKYGKVADFEGFAAEVTEALKLADSDATMREIFTDEALATLRQKYLPNSEGGSGGEDKTLGAQAQMIQDVIVLYVAAKYGASGQKDGELIQRLLALYRSNQLRSYTETLFQDATGRPVPEVRISTAISMFAKMHLLEEGQEVDGLEGPRFRFRDREDTVYEHIVQNILDVSEKAWGTSVIVDEAFRVSEIFLSELADKFRDNESEYTFSQWIFRSTYSNPDFMEKVVFEGKRSKILDNLDENIRWLKEEIGPEIFVEGSEDLKGFRMLMDQIPNFLTYVESGMARGGNNMLRVFSDRDDGYLIKKWVNILCEAYDRGWTLKFLPVWKDFMDYMEVKQDRTKAKNAEVRAAMSPQENRIEDFRQARRQADGVNAMRTVGTALFRPRNDDDNFDESLLGEMLIPIAPLANAEKRAETEAWLLELANKAVAASDAEIDGVYQFFSGEKLPPDASDEQIQEQRKFRKNIADLMREKSFPQVLVELDQLFKDEAVAPALDFIRDKIDDGEADRVLELVRKILGIRKYGVQ